MIRFLVNMFGVVTLGQAMSPTVQESVLECFTRVTVKYFREDMVLLLVSTPESHWMEEIIAYVIGSMNWSVELSNEDYLLPESDYFYLRLTRQRAQNIIILMRRETEDPGREIDSLARNRMWNPSARILIVVESDGCGEEILRSLWREKRAMNAVVMAIGEDGIRLATWHPFRNGGELVVVDASKNGLNPVGNMYDNEIPENFNGYTLKLATWYVEPYVMKPKRPGVYESGLEVQIIQELRKWLNFTLEYVQAPEGENAYIAVVNGTPSGLFGLVYRGEADFLCLGMRARYDRILIADPLIIHTEDRSVWIVPLEDKVGPGFYVVFEEPVWIAVAVTFVAITVMLVLLNRNDTQHGVLTLADYILESIRYHLHLPIVFNMTRTRLRMFAILMYFYSQHLTTAYSSTFVRILTTPPASSHAETPTEAVESGLVAYLYPSGKPRYNQTEHELWNKILQPKNHVFAQDSAAILYTVSVKKTGFTLMLENVAKYTMGKDRKLQMVRILDKPFGPYQVSFFITRGHPLKNIFNRKMASLFESGIIGVWRRKYLSGYRKMRKREIGFRRYKPMKLERIWMVLASVVSSWILSFAVFVLEVIVGRFTSTTNGKARERQKPVSTRIINAGKENSEANCQPRKWLYVCSTNKRAVETGM